MSDRLHDWPQRLDIDSGVFLAAGAIVTGEVSLGSRVSVWFNTVLRGDTDRIEIGDDTNLQDLTLVHVDHGQAAIVGRRVTVGHRAILHGCVVEDDCLIGMGAIVLSGARVGAGSLVAAGALVREGQSIPPGSLAVGAPARVIGPVGDAHRDAIRSGAEHYVALSREYLARGFGQRIPSRDDLRGALGVLPAPMDFSEWGRALATLAEGPDHAAALLSRHGMDSFLRRPSPEKWCALEVIVHLMEADVEVFAPRLERLLTEAEPRFTDMDIVSRRRGAPVPDEAPQDRIARWRETRAAALARLAPCGRADWIRRGVHERRGSYTLADMTRSWVDHDLSHRRQMLLALEAER